VTTIERIRHDLHGAGDLTSMILTSIDDEIDKDLPAYLVFMILANVRKLKQVSPDHILVKAVQAALEAQSVNNPAQSTFDL